MGTDEEFQNIENAKASARRVQELEDHNNAIAGRFDTGKRINRGMKAKHDSGIRVKKENDSLLKQALKMSAEYAKLYHDTMSNFQDAEVAICDALIQGVERVNAAQATVRNLLVSASTTIDGRSVFRNADGTVYDQDGNEITSDELDGVTWRDNAPSWEGYQHQLQDLKDAQEFLARMQAHDQRLIVLRVEIEDEDNPPSEDRLTEIGEELDAIRKDATNVNVVKNDFEVLESKQALDPTINFDF